jgi:hypothetical protein
MAAREFFDRHPHITRQMIKELRGMNAYAYSVLADRAYGKIVEKQQIVATGVSLEDILRARKRVEDSKLGRQISPPDPPVADDTDVPPADV